MERAEEEYTKNVTQLYTRPPALVEFEPRGYVVLAKEATLAVEDLEDLQITDPSRYRRRQLVLKIERFGEEHPGMDLRKAIAEIRAKELRVERAQKEGFEVAEEYRAAFHQLQKEQRDERLQQRRKLRNREKIRPGHVEHLRGLMGDPRTMHLSISSKQRLLNRRFPEAPLSRKSVHRISRDILGYRCKRITQRRPRRNGNKALMRVLFMGEFLSAIQDPKCAVLVIDEVGFNKPLLRYGYARKGEPLVVRDLGRIRNLTCTACISADAVEALRFFDEGGTRNENYAEYFGMLVKALRPKFPGRTLLLVQDNLWAHKSTLVCRQMRARTRMLLTPPNTPQFSPIENVFALVKKKLRLLEYEDQAQVAAEVARAMFGLT